MLLSCSLFGLSRRATPNAYVAVISIREGGHLRVFFDGLPFGTGVSYWDIFVPVPLEGTKPKPDFIKAGQSTKVQEHARSPVWMAVQGAAGLAPVGLSGRGGEAG